MTPYWLLFFLVVWRAGSGVQRGAASLEDLRSWRAMFWVLVLMIGLRHEVGGDWISYMDNFAEIRSQSLPEAMKWGGDPAFSLLSWLAGQLGGGVYLVNLVCAGFFTWGLVAFCRAQPMPWLALLVAVPYLVIVVAMGYTRQATAIGFAMLGFVALAEQKIVRFVIFVICAALFHKLAVILIPLAAMTSSRWRLWTLFWVALTALLAYELLLQGSVATLRAGYLEDEYESSGAAVRVAMNAVPAVVFLLFRKRFNLRKRERVFWTWMSLSALGIIGLLLVSSSSAAVDRVALYWIPLQLFVLSRLPNALQQVNRKLWLWAVIIYSAAVMFVWLVFAVHAYAWLPYQFYPWVWLWA